MGGEGRGGEKKEQTGVTFSMWSLSVSRPHGLSLCLSLCFSLYLSISPSLSVYVSVYVSVYASVSMSGIFLPENSFRAFD